MKWMNCTIKIVVLMLSFNTLIAQQSDPQEFTIPLSNPNATGKLLVDLHEGGVNIEGYSGKEIVVSVRTYKDEDEDDKSSSREGLKRIPNMGMNFEVAEDNNTVKIVGGRKRQSDFTIKVPRQFSLSISTHHDGEVKISDVAGEIVVDTHHSGMELKNVGGSVVANSHHGDIIITFASIKSGVPMAFSTYHGDVDVTFPSNLNASVKMKSEKGDIYTDFDMELNAQKPQIQKTGKGTKKVSIMEWMKSKIGSGGPEYMFTTHHGDIILRKK